MNDGKDEWYILPGGGQGGEEMLTHTVEREVREEAEKEYTKYLGNEEVGDPECFE